MTPHTSSSEMLAHALQRYIVKNAPMHDETMLRRCAHALRLAASSPDYAAGMRWQRMETAPRDGRSILIFALGAVSIASWNERGFWNLEIDASRLAYDCGGEIQTVSADDAKGWMPLPVFSRAAWRPSEANATGDEPTSNAKLADDLARLCCAETEGRFFDLVTDRIQDIIAVLRASRSERMSFHRAMYIAECGFLKWKGKEHNAKWFKRIDGTPIPNDLLVNIAEAFSNEA